MGATLEATPLCELTLPARASRLVLIIYYHIVIELSTLFCIIFILFLHKFSLYLLFTFTIDLICQFAFCTNSVIQICAKFFAFPLDKTALRVV